MSLRQIAVALLMSGIIAGCGYPPLPNLASCGADGSCPGGQQCEADLRCHPTMVDAPVSMMDAAGGSPDGKIDAAPIDAPIDAAPDAPSVACSGDGDCQTPPNLCAKPGTCNLSVHECVFPSVDCSSQNTCGSFGSCQNASPGDVCDSGSKSRTCMDFACQLSTGLCVASPRVETVDCNGITNGRACGDDGQQISCTSCDYGDVCDTSASQSCTFAHEKCQSDACVRQSNEVRNLTCTRSGPPNPDDACGAPTVGGCGVCLNPSNLCAATGGQQQCTVTHHGCVSGACGSIPGGTTTQSCTPGSQEGNVCGTCGAGEIGDWTCISGVCVSGCHCFQGDDGVPRC